MTATDSYYHAAVAALVTALDAIEAEDTGDNLDNYTVQACVVQADFFDDSPQTTKVVAGSQSLVIVIPDEEEAVERVSKGVVKVAHVDVAALTPFKPSSERPWAQPSLTRATIQDRLVLDVERAVYADVTLGGTVENCEIILRDRSADRTYIEGWACVFMRVRLQWEEIWGDMT